MDLQPKLVYSGCERLRIFHQVLRQIGQPALGCPADQFAHGPILPFHHAAETLHGSLWKQHLYIFHGSFNSMDSCFIDRDILDVMIVQPDSHDFNSMPVKKE